MDIGSSRLVQRLQRKLRSKGSRDGSGSLAWSDMVALKVRLRSLHELDKRFTHVGLSHYVMDHGVTSMPGRVGGDRVATEV